MPPIAAKEKTADKYIIYADGVDLALINFTLRRNTSTELATITLPIDYKDILAAATVISIDMVSLNFYGIETTTEIFTGGLDDLSTTYSSVTVNCSGTASWPASAERLFANVSYISDDANYYSCRLNVDPSFSPGDTGFLGLREININRVVIIANNNQAYMELSDVGQV